MEVVVICKSTVCRRGDGPVEVTFPSLQIKLLFKSVLCTTAASHSSRSLGRLDVIVLLKRNSVSSESFLTQQRRLLLTAHVGSRSSGMRSSASKLATLAPYTHAALPRSALCCGDTPVLSSRGFWPALTSRTER